MAKFNGVMIGKKQINMEVLWMRGEVMDKGREKKRENKRQREKDS